MIVMAFVMGVGCVDLGPSERYATTSVTASVVESRTPPLPLFILRLASSELTLGAEQAREVESLVIEAGVAVRPIDEARVVFLEILASSIEEGRYRAPAVTAAAERVVHATEQASPTLESALQRLHSTLTVSQRAALVQVVGRRIDAWAPSWRAPSSAAAALDDHRWLSALKTESFDRAAAGEMGRDITVTARAWSLGLARHVATALETLDAAARRDLVTQLRTDSLRQSPR